MPSKALCLLFPVSMLMTGCFNGASITKDEFAPDDSKVFFYLQDGSYIKSFSGNHHRMDTGYQIVGEIMTTKRFPQKFDGVVGDAEIAEVKVEKLNVVGTVLGCVLGGMVIAGFVVGASLGPIGSVRF